MKILRIVLKILLGVFGVSGNLLVCVAIATRKRLKTVGNMFLFNLALADLGVLLVCLPLVIIRRDFPYSWPFGEVACKILFPFTDIFYGVSIGSIVAISFHRYRMIVHCMETQLTANKAKVLIAIIWVLSYVFLVLPVNLVMELEETNGKTLCLVSWPKLIHRQLYVVFVFALFYLLPLIIILGTYLRIRRKLSIDSFLTAQMRDDLTCTVKTRMEQNQKALRLLTPVVVAFAVLVLPINALRLAAAFHRNIRSEFRYLRLLYDLSALLLLANSSINCVIYAVVNKDFRREFERLLCCGCLKQLSKALPSRKRLLSEGSPRFHSLYSTNDPRTIEEMLSQHELDEVNQNCVENGEPKSDQKRKARFSKKLKHYEVRNLLENEDYANSVHYCAYGEKLTIVVK